SKVLLTSASTKILPSGWMTKLPRLAMFGNLVCTLPPLPNELSRVPFGLYRTTSRLILADCGPVDAQLVPAATTVPSLCTATAGPSNTESLELDPTLVVRMPPEPKLVSSVPAADGMQRSSSASICGRKDDGRLRAEVERRDLRGPKSDMG